MTEYKHVQAQWVFLRGRTQMEDTNVPLVKSAHYKHKFWLETTKQINRL
jgi:hypothetical protein